MCGGCAACSCHPLFDAVADCKDLQGRAKLWRDLVQFVRMSPEGKQRIQLALALAIVVAGLRTGYILYQRHQENIQLEKQKQAKNVGYSNADFYVSPKKLHPYDLKSARELTSQPVWVKEGYRYTYYPFDSASHHADFKRDAGMLLPLEKLEIKDVVTDAPAAAGGPRQMVAVFQKSGKNYAVPIGFERDEQYSIYSDEMFFVEDPHDLYKHWPADVWQSVEQHEVKPGMNELQADFAIGMGVPDSGSSSYEKTVRYPNGGKPLVVIYHDGKATAINPGTPES